MLQEGQTTKQEVLDVPVFVDDASPVLDYQSMDDQAPAHLPGRGRWRTRRRWIAASAAVVLVALAAGIVYAATRPPAAVVTFTTQPVLRGTLALTVSATGSVTAPTYDANFADQGTVTEIDVQVGDSVSAGQVLAKLKTLDGSTKTLKAPHAGTVANVGGVVDEPATSGAGTNAFIEIVDLSALQVQSGVDESDIRQVAKGQSVDFTVAAYSDTQAFHGTVRSIAPLGQSSSGSVTYAVTIDVDTHNLQGATMMPGMTANVTITTTRRSNVLLLPASAITYAQQHVTPSGEAISAAQFGAALQQATQLLTQVKQSDATAAQDHLTPGFVLERQQGKWVAKGVVLGLTDGTNYVVLAGLSEGELVVTGQRGGSSTGGSSGGPSTLPGGGPGGGIPGGGAPGTSGGGFGG
jgi:HlyD family secretion protein